MLVSACVPLLRGRNGRAILARLRCCRRPRGYISRLGLRRLATGPVWRAHSAQRIRSSGTAAIGAGVPRKRTDRVGCTLRAECWRLYRVRFRLRSCLVLRAGPWSNRLASSLRLQGAYAFHAPVAVLCASLRKRPCCRPMPLTRRRSLQLRHSVGGAGFPDCAGAAGITRPAWGRSAVIG